MSNSTKYANCPPPFDPRIVLSIVTSANEFLPDVDMPALEDWTVTFRLESEGPGENKPFLSPRPGGPSPKTEGPYLGPFLRILLTISLKNTNIGSVMFKNSGTKGMLIVDRWMTVKNVVGYLQLGMDMIYVKDPKRVKNNVGY